MRTNVTIDLSDVQRMALASFIAGRPVKRLASREEVRDLATGLLEGIADSRKVSELSHPAPADKFTAQIEQTISERGMTDAQARSYKRGWTMQPFKR